MSDEITDLDAIPEALRERPQWLQWDSANETPRRPHKRGDFNVSWSDPDAWLSFQDAATSASERDTWGIGYVTAANNDRHPTGIVSVIDLDNAVTADGEIADWVPDLQPLFDRDCYIEWSPSHHEPGPSGLHIPVLGTDIPAWWSDSQIDDHTGADLLANKFCTVTGDVYGGAGGELPTWDNWLVDWLADLYENLTGDDPRDRAQSSLPDTGGDSYDGDEWLDEDTVADALEHIDPNCEYSQWRDIGFALGDHFDDHTARHLFDQWSRGSSKYDDDAEELIDDITSRTGSGVTIGTLVHLAKEGGWEPNAQQSPTRTPRELVAEYSDEYDSAAEVPDELFAYDGGGSDGSDGSDNGGSSDNGDGTDDERTPLPLNPDTVLAYAGLGEDASVSDLDDRQRAAVVWDLILQSDKYHVRVRRDNGALLSYDEGVWTDEGERALRHAAREALGSMNYGANVLTELKAQARSDPRVEVEPDALGVEAGYVAVENGLLDIRAAADGAGEDAVRELTPDDLALRRLPVHYNPDATAPEWEDLVDEWAETGRADALQEYVGYCLHAGGMPIHRALLLVGSGSNGKGTFLHVVRQLLGDDNTTSIELQTLANEKDALAQFHKSIANIDDDLSARQIGAGLGMFKKLVGGDHVRARQLYEEGFEFQATGKHLYAANEVPEVEVPDDDEAFWRRWLLVEFPNHYPPSERDHELRDRLSTPEALSGVLNWAIDGWARLLDAGQFTGEETSAHQKRQRWQRWGESVNEFISECVERDEEADRVTTAEAHERFTAWAREHGKDRASQRKLTNKLKAEDVGYKSSIRIDGNVTRGYDALGFTDETPEVEEIDRQDDDDEDDSRQASL